MKKALIVTSVASMIQQFNLPNIELLQKLGYQVTVCTNFEEPGTIPQNESKNLFYNLNKKNIEAINIPFNRIPFHKNNLRAYRKIKSIMTLENYDLIHCQSPVGGAITRLARIFSGKNKGKLIYTAHGFHFYKGAPKKNWLLYYPVEKLLSKYTDTLITINKEDYEQSQKFKAKNLKYIPGVGIDLKKYNRKNIINMAAKRKELGIKKDSFVIVSIGELNKNKNHQIVLKALSNLKDNNFDYLICGEGSEETKLRKLSVELNIQDKVHFLGFRKDINEILYLSELFVFPSYREGLSMALMEAMAMGLPAIVSDIRGNRDLIDDKKGGYLFQPDNCLELSSLINKLYTEKETRNKMSNYNLVKIKEFSIKNSLKEMEKVISEY